MARWTWHWTIVCVLVNAAVAAEQLKPLPTKTISRVDDAVAKLIKSRQLVGVAVGFVRQGRVAFVKGYGYADREKRIPVTAKTVFNWASNSKPLTAVLALQLVEQKKLELDADVRRYVPEFPLKGPVITIRDLLCHQSGLPHWPESKVDITSSEQTALEPIEPLATLSRFKEARQLFQPGERMSYSSYGFILLSAAMERAGKEPFLDQIQSRIAGPLGMTSLQLDVATKDQADWAVGYRKNPRRGIIRLDDAAHAWKMAAGGFKSNVEDFARFAEALLNKRLISAKMTTRMWTPQKTNSGETTNWGLGISVDTQNGEISHGGTHPEAVTQLVLSPQRQEAIVVMSNSGYANPAEIAAAVGQALHPR